MPNRMSAIAASLAGLAAAATINTATLAADCNPNAGPDVITGDLFAITRWGEVGGLTAFSYGPVLCNIGDTAAVCEANTNMHPVSAQAMYQWRPHFPGAAHGSFHQVGISWATHHFFALSNSQCCTDCIPTNGSTLGVHCSTAESASIMGSAFILGPRSEVDPVTGDFPVSHAAPGGPTTTAGRVVVPDADLDQANAINDASRYFGENLIVSPDDALADLDNNNATYRELTVSSAGITHNIAYTGGAVEEPAITAWADAETGVVISNVDVPGDGRFIIASSASDEDGDGTWRYEYAVFNMNSGEATAEFTVPAHISVSIGALASSGPNHHSGEIYDTANWSGARNSNDVHWQAAAPPMGLETNSINWGLMRSFGFDADQPPTTTSATLKLFASAGDSPAFNILAPVAACPADLNGDGATDTADLGILLAVFGSHGNPNPADLNGDGTIDTADLGVLLGAFGVPCP
ncbi:MAG: hypothetical protein H6814_07245 [Phycisphaeraceae bacterium]|nr:hypothetical protein [Phycisphaeraceae bacterium]